MKAPSIAFALGLAFASTVSQTAAAQSADSAPWTWRANVYAWFPNANATAQFPVPSGGSIDIETDPGGYLSKLQYAFMGSLEARKGPWSISGDVVVFDFGNTRSDVTSVDVAGMTVPLPTSTNVSIDLQGQVAEFGFGYSVVQAPGTVVDLIGGVRYLRVKAGLDWGFNAAPPGVPTQSHVERKRDFWDGVVGVRGRSEFAEHWYVSYYADVGTGSSDLTWQAFAGVGYRFGWGDALVGYRYLAYRFDHANPVSEMAFSGPLVGVGFRF